MGELLNSPALERELAINHVREMMIKSWRIGNTVEARWHEKCLTELEKMSDEEFAEQYKDADE